MTKREVYKLARENGYQIKYGNRHYLRNGAVVRDDSGQAVKGYEIIDLHTGIAEWGTYDENFDHLYTWEDVLEFMKQHTQK